MLRLLLISLATILDAFVGQESFAANGAFQIYGNKLSFPDGSEFSTAPKDGSTVLSGSGTPGSIVAKPGDFYIDTNNHILYGPYVGSWPIGVSLVGPSGLSPDLTNYYTKQQVDTILSSVSSLISLQSPSGLVAGTAGTTINLTWNPSAQSTSYNLYWGTSSGITKSSQKISNISGTTYQHNGLTRGTVYFYAVTANYSTGEGPLSPELFKQVSYSQANPIREFELNNSTATSTAINIGGGSFRGQLSSRATNCTSFGDLDYYNFTSNGGVVNFNITHDATPYQGGMVNASILDQNGTSVLSSTYIQDKSVPVPVTLSINTTPGLYYLLISSKFDSSGCPSTMSGYEIFTKDYAITPEYVY